jgi:hypothetical protein
VLGKLLDPEKWKARMTGGPGSGGQFDFSSALHAALGLPAQIAAFSHLVLWCTIVLATVGLLNAALSAGILFQGTRTRATASEPAIANAAPKGAEAQPAAVTCACGAPVSARSKSGRCRRCAQAARSTNGKARAGVYQTGARERAL